MRGAFLCFNLIHNNLRDKRCVSTSIDLRNIKRPSDIIKMKAKRIAVIGLGPGGAITIDALAQEKAFDTIRVFERKEAPGGCW